MFGTGIGDFDVEVSRPADDPATADVDESDVDYLEMTTTFTMPTNFLFFNGPNIDLRQTKRVYVAS